MNSTDITALFEIVIALVFAIATYFIIPFIKSKITAAQWNNLQEWAKVLVQAYEVIIKGVPKLGNEKRKQVMDKLQQLCDEHGYTFDEEQLRIALENAWANMIAEHKGTSSDNDVIGLVGNTSDKTATDNKVGD